MSSYSGLSPYSGLLQTTAGSSLDDAAAQEFLKERHGRGLRLHGQPGLKRLLDRLHGSQGFRMLHGRRVIIVGRFPGLVEGDECRRYQSHVWGDDLRGEALPFLGDILSRFLVGLWNILITDISHRSVLEGTTHLRPECDV